MSNVADLTASSDVLRVDPIGSYMFSVQEASLLFFPP